MTIWNEGDRATAKWPDSPPEEVTVLVVSAERCSVRVQRGNGRKAWVSVFDLAPLKKEASA